jgi:hypothetical protein
VNQDALANYAKEAADFSTKHMMPHLDFAVNHYGRPDLAMFDFTSLFQAENSCRVLERQGKKLLTMLVGDSLLEVRFYFYNFFEFYFSDYFFKFDVIMQSKIVFPVAKFIFSNLI